MLSTHSQSPSAFRIGYLWEAWIGRPEPMEVYVPMSAGLFAVKTWCREGVLAVEKRVAGALPTCAPVNALEGRRLDAGAHGVALEEERQKLGAVLGGVPDTAALLVAVGPPLLLPTPRRSARSAAAACVSDL